MQCYCFLYIFFIISQLIQFVKGNFFSSLCYENKLNKEMAIRFDKKRGLFDLPELLRMQIIREMYEIQGVLISRNEINYPFERTNYECNTTLALASSIPKGQLAIYTVNLYVGELNEIIGKFVVQINSKMKRNGIKLTSIYDGLFLYLNIFPTEEILSHIAGRSEKKFHHVYGANLAASCLILKSKSVNTWLYLPDLWKSVKFNYFTIGKVIIKHKYDILNYQLPKINVFEYSAYMTKCQSWNVGFRFFEDKVRMNSEFLIEFVDINNSSMGLINLVSTDIYGSFRSSFSTFEDVPTFPSHYWAKSLNSVFSARIAEINLGVVSQQYYRCQFNKLFFEVFVETVD